MRRARKAFGSFVILPLLAGASLVLAGCEDAPGPGAEIESEGGGVVVTAPGDGVTAADPDGDGTTLEDDEDAKELAKKLRERIGEVEEAGIFDEIERELREAGALAEGEEEEPEDGDGEDGGDGGEGPPDSIRITIEVVANVRALIAQLEEAFTEEQVLALRRRFEQERQQGDFPAGLTYVAPDGTIVVKLLAFVVALPGEDGRRLNTTLLHELAHAELRAMRAGGVEIDPPLTDDGHGESFTEVLDKLVRIFREHGGVAGEDDEDGEGDGD